MFRLIAFTAAVALLATSLPAQIADAQGFTFGAAPMQGSSDPVRSDNSPKAGRKARAYVEHCRLERHQVYNAQSQLIWQTIRVCS